MAANEAGRARISLRCASMRPIDGYFETGDWERMEHYAAVLEQYTSSEPLPFADFHIARGRALAAFGRGQPDTRELTAELERVRDQGEQLGILVALPAIETAINQLRGNVAVASTAPAAITPHNNATRAVENLDRARRAPAYRKPGAPRSLCRLFNLQFAVVAPRESPLGREAGTRPAGGDK